MNIKTYIYIVVTLLSVYAISGINFEKFWLKNKKIEARIFVIILSFAISYLVTNFIVDFLNASKIL